MTTKTVNFFAIILLSNIILFFGTPKFHGQATRQETPADDEVIKIDAQSVRVPIIVENLLPGESPAFTGEINSISIKAEQVSSPQTDPLKAVIINLSGRSVDKLLKRFDGLRKINMLKPVWIEVGAGKSKRKQSGKWNIISADDFESAVRQAETLFENGKTLRQSLLIITDFKSSLSDSVWKKLDPRLPSTSRAVTVITTQPPPKSEKKQFVFYRSNLNGQKTVVYSPEDYVRVQIDAWIANMRCFFVVSFDLPVEMNLDRFTVSVKATGDKGVLKARQTRTVNRDFAASPTELAEVLEFLRTMPDFKSLKAYKLPSGEAAENNAVSPQIKNLVINTGEINERVQKSAEKVFALHGLDHHLRAVVFEHRAATVFTWKLRSVSFSSKTVEILNDAEITALLAHEVGHLYFAKEIAEARLNQDARASRLTELKCDIIALMTLKKLGLPNGSLVGAVEKLIKSRTEAGLNSFSPESPAPEDRIGLTHFFAEFGDSK